MGFSDPVKQPGAGTLESIEGVSYRRYRGARPKHVWNYLIEIQAKYREQKQALMGRKGIETMPLSNPSVAAFHVEEGRYRVKLTDLVDTDPPTDHLDWGPRLRWFFNIYDSDGDPVLTEDGEQGQICPITGTSTGPKSKARPWIEALLGRAIENGDTGEEMQDEIIGKEGWALISDNEKGYSQILSISPLKKTGAKAAGKEAPF